MCTKLQKIWRVRSKKPHGAILNIKNGKVIIAGLARLERKLWLIEFFKDRYSEENTKYVAPIIQKRFK